MENQRRSSYQQGQGQVKNVGQPPQKSQGGYQKHKGSRPIGNALPDMYNVAGRRLSKYSNFELFFLAVLGGAFMCIGAFASILLIKEVAPTGAQNLLSSLGLTVGLLLVLLTNSVLVTESNVYVPNNFYHLSILKSCLRMFRFWSIAWIGNFVGAFLVALFIYFSQDYGQTTQQYFVNITALKLAHANGTFRNTPELIISGMLANWLIATVTFFAFASRNLLSQFIIIFLAFIIIIAANLQYFPANLGYFFLGAFIDNSKGLAHAIFFNLIPVTLGNILGGALLVGGMLFYLSRKR